MSTNPGYLRPGVGLCSIANIANEEKHIVNAQRTKPTSHGPAKGGGISVKAVCAESVSEKRICVSHLWRATAASIATGEQVALSS